MENITFTATTIPVVQNVHASPETDVAQIKNNLVKQVTSSVLWVDTMKFMLDAGVELFIEFGPQKVLTGMMKKIDRKATVLHVDTLEDVAAVKEYLEQE
jgi:[acyl-carrier-protein] S-malonyltransferase